MDQLRLGRAGLRVSRIGPGMMSYGDPAWRDWVLGEAEAEGFVRTAADLGITFSDTADLYSRGVSEELTGRLLRKSFPRREEVRGRHQGGCPDGTGPQR